MIVTQKKSNIFVNDIKADVQAAGYTNNDAQGKMGNDMTFEDEVAEFKDGKITMKKVHTFYSKFKNFRYVKAKLAHDTNEAEKQYRAHNKESDRTEWLRIKAVESEFNRDYMHQKYVREYYAVEQIFDKNDPIALKAQDAKKEILERIRLLTEPIENQLDELDIQDELNALWREYRQLHSRYNSDGTKKINDAAKEAELLRAHKNAMQDFYEWNIRSGVFENAYMEFRQELYNKKIYEGDEAWDYEMGRWKKIHTRSAIKQ